MPQIFTSDKDLGMKWMILGFLDMPEIVLDVGFFPDSGMHTIEEKSFSDLARWNEEGQPEKNVPARPFMRSVLDANATKYWTELAERAIQDIEAGQNAYHAHLALRRVGRVIAGDIQQSIRQWSDPKNSDWTITKKGFNNPLIDDEQLQKAVQYKIRRTRDPTAPGGEKEEFRGGVK